jgi:hypothetical protein
VLKCYKTTNFGRFEVRLLSENNYTQCSYWQQTNNPYFRCSNKPNAQKNNLYCRAASYITRECTMQLLCGKMLHKEILHFIWTRQDTRGLRWICEWNTRRSRQAWRHQRGNQKPQIEERHAMQWPKEKGQKNKQRYIKHYTEN